MTQITGILYQEFWGNLESLSHIELIELVQEYRTVSRVLEAT